MAQTTTKIRKQVRIPFVSAHQSRDESASKDQRYINCYVDYAKVAVTDDKTLFLTKRPGVSPYSTTTSGVGRGVWYFKGHMYHVTGTTLYRDNVSIKTLTAGLTAPCGAVEVLAPTEALFLCDGFAAWLIMPDGTISDIEQAFNNWAANTDYAYWDRVVPTTYATQTYWWYVTTPNTVNSIAKSGSSEPSWPASPTPGTTTVIDGGITWTCGGSYTSKARTYTNRAYSVGDLVKPSSLVTTYYYRCIKAGTTTAEPSWSLIADSVTTQNGVEFEWMGVFGGFPSPHIAQPCYLDGYVFLAAKETADVYNSYTVHPWSWNPGEFISADSFSGVITALARYNNYLSAFGEDNMELFYDAANATGSPLKRHDSFIMQTGTPAPYAIIQSEMMMAWVGTSSLGGKTIWLMDGFDPNDIGNVYISRLLTAETNPQDIRGYGLRLDGHLFFVLMLPTANKTLVLDIGTTLWYEWAYDGVDFPFIFYTTKNETIVVQHNNGELFSLLKSNYVDTVDTVAVPIDMTVITSKIDFDNRYRKFIHSIDLIGDLNTTTCTVQWSDDDYQTWNTGYSLSLATRPRITQAGTTRRRAFKITHTDNTPCRLEGLELVVTQGVN